MIFSERVRRKDEQRFFPEWWLPHRSSEKAIISKTTVWKASFDQPPVLGDFKPDFWSCRA
jgi:hypothetical protein